MLRKKYVILSMIIVLLFSSSLFAEETWKITSLDWEPYSGQALPDQGSSIQKLKDILAKNGVTLVVEFHPWKRAQKLAGEKDYVGYFPAWPEEVAEGFVASPAVDWSEIGLLKQKEANVSFDNMDTLFKNYKVGVVSTYVYPEVINAAMAKYPANTVKAMDETALLKMLSSGRFDAAVTDPAVMLYLAEKNGISNIEAITPAILKKELVIAFRAGDDNKPRLDKIKEILAGQ